MVALYLYCHCTFWTAHLVNCPILVLWLPQHRFIIFFVSSKMPRMIIRKFIHKICQDDFNVAAEPMSIVTIIIFLLLKLGAHMQVNYEWAVSMSVLYIPTGNCCNLISIYNSVTTKCAICLCKKYRHLNYARWHSRLFIHEWIQRRRRRRPPEFIHNFVKYKCNESIEPIVRKREWRGK